MSDFTVVTEENRSNDISYVLNRLQNAYDSRTIGSDPFPDLPTSVGFFESGSIVVKHHSTHVACFPKMEQAAQYISNLLDEHNFPT